MLLREAIMARVMYLIFLVCVVQTVTQHEQGPSFPLPLCLLAIFLVSWLWLDLRSALINVLTITMIVVNAVGVMDLCGIHYNQVTQSILFAGVGISVEFVSHITRSFALSTKPMHVERAMEATANMGSAVFAGVAMTNLPGILVLAFAKSQLVHIFFFHLNLVITLLGLAHGLIFLPVMLSYFGPTVTEGVVLQVDQTRAGAGQGVEKEDEAGQLFELQ